MNASALLGLSLLLLANLASGAPSNSTWKGSPPAPAPSVSRGDVAVGSKTATSPTTKSPANVVRSPTANSTRPVRETVIVNGSPITVGHQTNTKSSNSSHAAPTVVRGVPAIHGKSNSTRIARSVDEEEKESQAVPSTHPLFAHRQTSNITANLRPKLRAPGSPNPSDNLNKNKPTSDETELEEEEESSEDVKKPHVKSSVSKSTSSEESVVVSSSPVGAKARNASRPLTSFGSRSGSSTKAPAGDEKEESFF